MCVCVSMFRYERGDVWQEEEVHKNGILVAWQRQICKLRLARVITLPLKIITQLKFCIACAAFVCPVLFDFYKKTSFSFLFARPAWYSLLSVPLSSLVTDSIIPLFWCILLYSSPVNSLLTVYPSIYIVWSSFLTAFILLTFLSILQLSFSMPSHNLIPVRSLLGCGGCGWDYVFVWLCMASRCQRW